MASRVGDGGQQWGHGGEHHGARRRDDHERHGPQERRLKLGAEGERDGEQRERGDDNADAVALLDLLDE